MMRITYLLIQGEFLPGVFPVLANDEGLILNAI